MRHEPAKLLVDIVEMAKFLVDDTAEVSFDNFLNQRRLRLAVERALDSIGEEVVRLQSVDIQTCCKLSDYMSIIGLRYRLAHGYGSEIDKSVLWEAVRIFVPVLRDEALVLL